MSKLRQRSRINALQRAEERCEECGESNNLTIHHIIRAAHAPSLVNFAPNLKVLCRVCHDVVECGAKAKLRIEHIANHVPEKFLALTWPH